MIIILLNNNDNDTVIIIRRIIKIIYTGNCQFLNHWHLSYGALSYFWHFFSSLNNVSANLYSLSPIVYIHTNLDIDGLGYLCRDVTYVFFTFLYCFLLSFTVLPQSEIATQVWEPNFCCNLDGGVLIAYERSPQRHTQFVIWRTRIFVWNDLATVNYRTMYC